MLTITALYLSLDMLLRAHHSDLHLQGPADRADAALPALRFLDRSIEEGGADRMQSLFPEGYLFTVLLDGLAWVDQGLVVPERRPEARERLRALLLLAESPKGTDPFNPDLDPPYGIFYQGWVLRTRVGMGLLGEMTETELATLKTQCNQVARALDRSTTPFLPSYSGMSWPVDSVVAVSALPFCDRLSGTDTLATRSRWLELARRRVDPRTGLLPHTADVISGEPSSGPRGSSLSVMARLLHDLDPDWGREHYEGLRSRFFVSRLGLPGVLEHEGGGGEGDIDAGPLILGVSLSATVVSAGAARLYGDKAFADAVLDVGEIIGLPLSWSGEKRYALGLLPVGDAFGVWSTAPVNWGAPPTPPAPASLPGFGARAFWDLGWGLLFLSSLRALLRTFGLRLRPGLPPS